MRGIRRKTLVFVLAIGLAAPVTAEPSRPGTAPSPSPSPARDAADGRVDLDFLLRLAADRNPTLRQAREQIAASLGKARQAGLYPNPTFRLVAEQIGVRGNGRGNLPGEYHAGLIEQRFVTAGKLSLSRRKYQRRAEAAEYLAAAQAHRVANDVRIRYWRMLGAEEVLKLRRALAENAAEAASLAGKLFRRGQTARPRRRAADVALSKSKIAAADAEDDYARCEEALMASVGGTLPGGRIAGELRSESAERVRDEVLRKTLERSPEVLAAAASLRSDEVALERERVGWIPDVTVEAGAGYNYDSEEPVGFAGVQVEILLFDRNQGTVQQAAADLSRQRAEGERVALELRAKLAEEFRRYRSARSTLREFDDVILPQLEAAFQDVSDGYRNGQVARAAVLAARRDLLDARVEATERLVELRESEVLLDGFLLSGGLSTAEGPTPAGHVDAVPKPR